MTSDQYQFAADTSRLGQLSRKSALAFAGLWAAKASDPSVKPHERAHAELKRRGYLKEAKAAERREILRRYQALFLARRARLKERLFFWRKAG